MLQRGMPRILYLFAVSHFLVGTNALLLGGVLEDIAVDLQTTPASVGYSIALYAATVALAAPMISVAGAKLNSMVIVAAGTALMGFGTIIAAQAADLNWFVVGRLFAAFGAAALVPTAIAIAPTVVHSRLRGRALSTVGLGFASAAALGSPVGIALADHSSWRVSMTCIGLLALVLSLTMLRTNTVVGPIRGATSRTATQSMWRNADVPLLLLVNLLISTTFNVIYIFSSVVASGVTEGDGTRLAVLLAASGVGGLAGTVLGGWLSDKVGNHTSGLWFLAGLSLTCVVLALPREYGWSLVTFFVWGFLASAALIPHQDRLSEGRGPVAAVLMSWNSSAMYGGLALAPVLGARLSGSGSSAVTYGGGLAAAGALGIWVFLGHLRR